MNLSFVVEGDAIPKARPRIVRVGRGVRAYTPGKTVNYEQLFGLRAMQAMKAAGMVATLAGVVVRLSIAVVPPASWGKRKTAQAIAGEILPTAKPDIDNVAKSVLDGLSGIVYQDDKQVIELSVRKHYAAAAAVQVHITEYIVGA